MEIKVTELNNFSKISLQMPKNTKRTQYMKKAIESISLLFFILLLSASQLFAQSKKELQTESQLTSKKWVCLDVKRKKLTKIDFRFEVGNELSLSIDKKYAFKNNDYNYSSGTWKLDKKFLYFFYNSRDGDNRVLSSKYKIQKLNQGRLMLKRTEAPKGRLEFK